MSKLIFITAILLLVHLQLSAQDPIPEKTRVFDDKTLARVDITINPDFLTQIYDDVWSDYEFPAIFKYTRGTDVDNFDNVGFRLRGNSSRVSAKKSFKISINSFSNLKFLGLEKLNLNGEHNDPSIIRSKLCWDIFRDFEVVGSRASHLKMYINNQYYGLYMNIEHIDDEFVQLHYGSQAGNLYKCTYPADLAYISSNPDDYKPANGPAYELKTNEEADDYSDLAHFIDVLNNTSDANLPAELEKIFNVNNFLKYLAVEYFTGQWDGYSFNKNNFYLYNNPLSGKFEFIAYDVDNTFGIDWFGIDWSTRDIYNWENGSESRPLNTRILANQTYLDRFSYYMNQLLDSIVDPTIIFPRIDEIKTMISQAAYDDTYRTMDYGWSTTDFDNSYTQALSTTHTPIGLKPYITARYNSAKAQLLLNNIAPIIINVDNNIPLVDQEIVISCSVEDEDTNPEVMLYYKIDGGSEQSMLVPASGVGAANWIGGQVHQVSLSALSSPGTIEYYLVAGDNAAATTREPVSGYHVINIYDFEAPPLYINEFMASNISTNQDNNGAYSDWIEIYNGGTSSIYLGDKYLSDDFLDRQKWQMPDMSIGAGEYLVFWASGDKNNGSMHTNFKLSADGEQIAIFSEAKYAYSFIDSVSYGLQTSDITEGRNPDGTGGFVTLDAPTPGYSNLLTSIVQYTPEVFDFKIYPNPFFDQLQIKSAASYSGILRFDFFNLAGKIVHQENKQLLTGSEIIVDLSNLSSGTYILRMQDAFDMRLLSTLKLIKR